MMICKKCGTANDDNASVCKKCGKPLTSSASGKKDLFDFSLCSGLMVAFSVIALILLMLPSTRKLEMTSKADRPDTAGQYDVVSPMLRTIREKQSVKEEVTKIEENEKKIAPLKDSEEMFEKKSEAAANVENAINDAVKAASFAEASGVEDVKKAAEKAKEEAANAIGKLEAIDAATKLSEMTTVANEVKGFADAAKKARQEAKSAATDVNEDDLVENAEEYDSIVQGIAWRTSVYDKMKLYYEEKKTKALKNAMLMSEWETEDALQMEKNRLLKDSKDETFKELSNKNDEYLEKSQMLAAFTEFVENEGADNEGAKAEKEKLAKDVETLTKELNDGVAGLVESTQDSTLKEDLETFTKIQDKNKDVQAKNKVVQAKEKELEAPEKEIKDLDEQIQKQREEGNTKKVEELEASRKEKDEKLKEPREELSKLKADYTEAKNEMDGIANTLKNHFQESELNKGALNGIMVEHDGMKGIVDTLMFVFCLLLAASFFATIISWVTKMYRVRIVTTIANTVLALLAFFVPLFAWTFESKWSFDISGTITYGLGFAGAFVFVLICALGTLFTGFAFFADDLFGKKN